MTPCGFTYAHYRESLQRAEGAGYTFAPFDGVPPDGRPFILLRHDVDFSLELALPVARLEAEMGIRATVFVLPHAHYNPLGTSLAPLREIVGLGHHLGLHYDLSFYAAHGLPLVATLRAEAATLEARVGHPVSVVARHHPGRGPRAGDLDVRPLLDAYAPSFTRDVKYVSDSCQFWREGCFCTFLDPARHKHLQVLTHPIWWSDDGRPAYLRLREHTAARIGAARDDARRELAYYATLEHLGNRKLFEEAADE